MSYGPPDGLSFADRSGRRLSNATVASGDNEDGPGDQEKGHQRQVRNRQAEHAQLDGATATDPTETRGGTDLEPGVVRRNGDPGHGQRERRPIDARTALPGGHAKHDDEWIH